MEELIAKRYIKAVGGTTDIDSLKNMSEVFSVLSESFKNEKFLNIVQNPNVSSNDKLEILLEAVKLADSTQVNNLIRLLVENKRIEIIPSIASVLRKDISKTTKTFDGVVYSDSEIDEKTMQDLSKGLSKKLDSNISLRFVKDNFSGIKVDVADLGVEINFSKTRINNQIIEHIIKAI